MLLSAGPAQAVSTDMYDNFTHCPTSSPAMNNPETAGVVCVSSIVRGGFLRVGAFQAPITSPIHAQFAMTIGEEGLNVVPGSTTLESTPFTIPNPFYTPPGPPAAAPETATPPQKQATKQKKVKKNHKKKGQKGKKKGHKKHKKKHKKKKPQPVPPVTPPIPPTPPAADPNIKIAVEPVGDVSNLNLEGMLEGEGPVYQLGTRIHLEGVGLGPNCFIGSPADPIELEPIITSEPSGFGIFVDPNGFQVEVIELAGLDMEDETFAVPGATGCGEGGSLDPQINAAIGLPAVSGGSKLIFTRSNLEMVGSENDGSAPDNGALLQAAFDAAK